MLQKKKAITQALVSLQPLTSLKSTHYVNCKLLQMAAQPATEQNEPAPRGLQCMDE
jgi:hypothetical protein